LGLFKYFTISYIDLLVSLYENLHHNAINVSVKFLKPI